MFWANLLIYILLAVYVIVCLLMVLVILMQRSKQDGIGSAFGGGMMSSALGPSASAVLVKSTVTLAVAYFLITLSLAYLYSITSSSAVIAGEIEGEVNLQQMEEQAAESAGKLPDTGQADAPTPTGSAIVNEGEAASNLGQDPATTTEPASVSPPETGTDIAAPESSGQPEASKEGDAAAPEASTPAQPAAADETPAPEQEKKSGSS